MGGGTCKGLPKPHRRLGDQGLRQGTGRVKPKALVTLVRMSEVKQVVLEDPPFYLESGLSQNRRPATKDPWFRSSFRLDEEEIESVRGTFPTP